MKYNDGVINKWEVCRKRWNFNSKQSRIESTHAALVYVMNQSIA